MILHWQKDGSFSVHLKEKDRVPGIG